MKLIVIASLFATSLIAADIDWTPRFTALPTATGAVRRAVFSDGTRNFMLNLDSDSRMEARGAGARITSTRVPSATFDIHGAKTAVTLPAPKEQSAMLRAAAHAHAMKGYEEISDVSEAAEVLPINGWKTHRFTFSYGLHGRRFAQSVTFLVFEDGQQVVLSTVASPKEFEEAQAMSDFFMRTFHEVAKGAPRGS